MHNVLNRVGLEAASMQASPAPSPNLVSADSLISQQSAHQLLEFSKVDWRITSSTLVALIIIFAIIWSRVPIDWEDEYRSLYESVASDTPLIGNVWNVYLDEDTDTLIYVKENCSDADTRPPFFLHLVAVDPNDKPLIHRTAPFDNRDFDFDSFGRQLPPYLCVIRFSLPYDVSSISTGQYVGKNDQITNLWSGEAAVSQNQIR